jgi:hypothetical protein
MSRAIVKCIRIENDSSQLACINFHFFLPPVYLSSLVLLVSFNFHWLWRIVLRSSALHAELDIFMQPLERRIGKEGRRECEGGRSSSEVAHPNCRQEEIAVAARVAVASHFSLFPTSLDSPPPLPPLPPYPRAQQTR